MKTLQPDWLGVPGVIGVGLLLFSLAFYLGSIAPAKEELSRLQREVQRLQADAAGADAAMPDAAGRRGVQPEQPLAFNEFPELLKEVNALAEQRGVTIERAAYVLNDTAGQRRMEISLPMKVGYPSLRGYLSDLLMLRGSPSIVELTLKRQQADEALVEANVRLTFSLAPAS